MKSVRMKLAFEWDGVAYRDFEVSARFRRPRTRQGEVYVSELLGCELKKELLWAEIQSTLPNLRDLAQLGRQRFTVQDFVTGSYFDRVNTRWIWFELANTLFQIRILLAEAKAYRSLEPQRTGDPIERPLVDVHFRKMEKLNLAVFYLAKIEDLVLRLLFENLGASLIQVDTNKRGWERKVTWENIREGLKDRGRPALAQLTEEEYKSIRDILGKFRQPAHVRRFVEYRDALTHRLTPSVDYPEFYAYLESREAKVTYDSKGQKKAESWNIGSRPTKAKYRFDELWGFTLKTMEHYLCLLGKLRQMPRFGPQAVR